MKLCVPKVSILLNWLAAGTIVLLPQVSAAASPVWTGIPNPPLASKLGVPTDKCKKILVIGDSIAAGLARKNNTKPYDGIRLETSLRQFGYCAIVYNEGIGNSTPCIWNNYWFLDDALNRHPDADLVVGHFVGNERGCVTKKSGTPEQVTWTKPYGEWLKQNAIAINAIDQKITARGLPMYWVIPAPAYKGCYPPDQLYVSALWRSWAKWQQSHWPKDRQIDFRQVWGGDTYIPGFTFGYRREALVRTDTMFGKKDCLHFNDLGYNFMANSVRAVVYKEWLK